MWKITARQQMVSLLARREVVTLDICNKKYTTVFNVNFCLKKPTDKPILIHSHSRSSKLLNLQIFPSRSVQIIGD